MEVLAFPPEIVHVILVHAVLGRGIKRGLRLRLVCKVFAYMVHPALFETYLMDDHPNGPFGSTKWQFYHQHGASELWNRYLIFRSLHEQNPAIKRFVEIRHLAKSIHRETEATLALPDIVEALSWLASSHGTHTVYSPECFKWGPLTTEKHRPKADLELNMLTAAHLNLLPLAKRLLLKGHHNPASHNYLFAPPIQAAAQAGNLEILRLLQEYLPDSKFELWSVKGAAMRGDIDILKVALHIGQGDSNDESALLVDGRPYGSIEHTTETGRGILLARECGSNPEVYEYLTGALVPWPEALEAAHSDLIINVGRGNLTMVRYLLGLGVAVQQPFGYYGDYRASPLVAAAKFMHNDVAMLLLEHGADPNYVADEWFVELPLHEAATSSNLSLAQKLLQHGARTARPMGNSGRWPAMFWAFAREHESMVRLLLEHGADFQSVPESPKQRLQQIKQINDFQKFGQIKSSQITDPDLSDLKLFTI